jgi:hypothetical protein
MSIIVVESCHSTWIFEPRQLRFCRIVKGVEVGRRRVSTQWRPYRDLEIDERRGAFTVYLDEERTRLIRSWRHTGGCRACGGYDTMELSLKDIRRAVA